MQPEDVRLVRAYLRTCADDSPYLFISTRGIPLERRSYWDLMQKYGEVAAIPKPKRRFHALRHAIAVHLLDTGADVAFVQDRLGHANIQNTMVYMRYTPRHPRCPDTAAVCQSSCGLNRPWCPSFPEVLALSGTLTHRLSLIEKVSYPAASTRRPRALVRARR